MPFSPAVPRSFTPNGVREHAPTLSGVYGIANAAEWIYIGETDNIQLALMQHLQDVNVGVLSRGPTGFAFEVCDRARRLERQNRLVLEYEPFCNRRWSHSSYA